MDHYRGKVDPDYESYNSAVELNEEEDKKENLIKIRKIIDEEYSKEVNQRQEQVEQIELQICKVRKVLHILRYALITSYYKKKELEYNGTENESSISDNLINPDKQNRIHPAVKKLLGKNVDNLDILNIKDKRKSNARNNLNHRLSDIPSASPESKRIKLNVDKNQISDSFNKALQSRNENTLEFVQSRKKTKYRVVVGNISKWMPSSEDDALSHKWMVYVRGPKENPDVSHFIDKVVYYLHPSYKPHDVVEVSESPFHLSRRGWGEFPVRVQIFFKVTLNKPIDVVHNIKLDKTYSGRQTLGNETIIDVFLYDDNNHFVEDEPVPNHTSNDIEIHDIKVEEFDIKIEDHDLDTTTPSTEHDYCTELEAAKNEEITFVHSYCLPPSQIGFPKPKKEKIEQDESNALIYGLDTYLQIEENTNSTITSSNHFKQLIELNRKDIKFNNTKIIVFGKKMEGSFLTNFGKLIQVPTRDVLSTNKLEGNKIKITLPQNRFKNMGEVLPYLFKRLPLYSDLANNANYKRMYPFTASTLKEFVSWNVGKRRSSEWSRARAIKKIVVSEKIQGVENWNTKTILMYGRSHDYTPYTSYGLFNRRSEEKNLLMFCYSSNGVKNNFRKTVVEDNQDVTINVDSDTEVTSPKKVEPTIDITDPHSKLECSYIKQAALNVGVILKPEEIIDGVKVNGAEMVILEAVKCLAENLIRRAKNHRVCTRTLNSNTSAINKEDVEVAISERPEMVCFQVTNERNKSFY